MGRPHMWHTHGYTRLHSRTSRFHVPVFLPGVADTVHLNSPRVVRMVCAHDVACSAHSVCMCGAYRHACIGRVRAWPYMGVLYIARPLRNKGIPSKDHRFACGQPLLAGQTGRILEYIRTTGKAPNHRARHRSNPPPGKGPEFTGCATC